LLGSLGGGARCIWASDDEYQPSRDVTLMAFGCEGVLDGFAVILMDDKAWMHLPRWREGFQGGQPPDE
jgi:hypothetical protein